MVEEMPALYDKEDEKGETLVIRMREKASMGEKGACP